MYMDCFHIDNQVLHQHLGIVIVHIYSLVVFWGMVIIQLFLMFKLQYHIKSGIVVNNFLRKSIVIYVPFSFELVL